MAKTEPSVNRNSQCGKGALSARERGEPLSSMFDDPDTVLSSAITRAFAEPAVHRLRVSEQYAERVVDADSPKHLIHGVFSAGPADHSPKGASRGSQFSGTTRVASASAEFWIGKAEVDVLTPLPAKGDTLTLTSRAGAPVYAISLVQHTDMGDLTLILVREDPPP